jgi:hypothetical protein
MKYANFANFAKKIWPSDMKFGPSIRWTLTEEEQREAIFLILSVSGQDGQSQDYIEQHCKDFLKSNKQKAKDLLAKLETDERVPDFLSTDSK